ncbi:DUF2335 domain-containing protein [Pseudoleptotrichia goodfellowii]|nr:DUF2335 domain-containing protein [Pseudoleptotrichia goodfellowii]MBF4805333.1 DUF2335 domain-containing protein [Pseudoleptotrichia goodfellowii]BBM35927.1 hypothetical protein JCM16774_0857 [Pseudoleptotrichia goodfellowii]
MPKKSKMTTNRRNDNGMREILLQKQEQYSGIIPHPSIVEGYERNCPGATDRILAMTENQLKCNQELAKMEQENINECRKEALKSEVENIKRGQILGFVILLTMIIGGFILIIFGKDAGGYGTIVASIMLGISSVIWNNKSKKEQEEKQ